MAELVAVQKINNDALKQVYGIVTDGTLWQFGKLVKDLFTLSKTALTINELKKVFGAIGYLMRDSLPKNPEIKHL